MKLSTLVFPLAAILFAPTPVFAEGPDAAPAAVRQSDAYIAFANHGGVRNWQADDRDTIYFEDNQRRWYKAELMSPAFDLPFTQFIGLDTEPGGRLDKWSALYVDGQRYAFKSFERIEGKPPKKVKKSKKAGDASKDAG